MNIKTIVLIGMLVISGSVNAGQLEAVIDKALCEPIAKSLKESINNFEYKRMIASGGIKRSEMVEIFNSSSDHFCSCYKSYLSGELDSTELQPAITALKANNSSKAGESVNLIMEGAMRSCGKEMADIVRNSIKSKAK
jgi:hypothetical protein